MKRTFIFVCMLLATSCLIPRGSFADPLPPPLEAALVRAGDNRAEINKALDSAPAAQQNGMRFLVTHMPDQDLQTLPADFLLENVQLAYQARETSPWKDQVSDELFLNNVLPYANITEPRDNWRRDFLERFQPLVKDARKLSEAAAILNQKVFPLLEVRYSRKRHRADQGPMESIKWGTASCTGLSILLIDACRAVGVPARFVGTPLWSDKSGNHSWVEIWDDGWHFTGAAEPTGDQLDQTWFVGRASSAQRDHAFHAIYAVSYRRTPQKFPLVWNRNADYVHAVNVTDRYTHHPVELPDGIIEVMFRVLDKSGGARVAATLKVLNADGEVVFQGAAKDERFDANDHTIARLALGHIFSVEVAHNDRRLVTRVTAERRSGPVTFVLDPPPEVSAGTVVPRDSRDAVESLDRFLESDPSAESRPNQKPFATVALTREHAARAEKRLWRHHVRRIQATRAAEMQDRLLIDGEQRMPFDYTIFGDKPANGRSLYISLHGGGGAPKRLNDRQWENQKTLYELEEGIYVAPRAPTNSWNLWHQEHIDRLFSRLIENMIVFEDVDPNRVYLMGYSAGGDGVFQLAPRMADRFAAAAMMAGHPNETSPLGLRNIAFTLHVGGCDAAYNRNEVARSWKRQLAELHEADPEGYVHWAKIYEDKGHWLDREDAAALPWMAKHLRNPLPSHIVWKQDDVTHARFYWLATDPEENEVRAEVQAHCEGQQIRIQAQGIKHLKIRLNDQLLDLDKPVTVLSGEKTLFRGFVKRTVAVLDKTLHEYGDPHGIFSGEIVVELPLCSRRENAGVREG